jgi:hypothetical protein
MRSQLLTIPRTHANGGRADSSAMYWRFEKIMTSQMRDARNGRPARRAVLTTNSRRRSPGLCATFGPRRTGDLGSGPTHPADLNAANRAASVGGREAAHGHVASLRPYRLTAGSRVLSSPSLLANGTWRGWSAPRFSRPTGADDGPARRPGARRSAWQALATDLHALAFGQGHGAGGLDRVGRARWAPSMRRVRDSAVVMVAWVVMALPGRPKRNRERSNGSIALPPAYRGGTLLPGRPGVVQGILLG